MAFPSIPAIALTSESTLQTTHAINLPAGIESGELLLVLLRVAAAGLIVPPFGEWTEIFQDNSDGTTQVTGLFYRKATGSEGASVEFEHGSARIAAIAWRISAAADPAVQAPQFSAVAFGSDLVPNPASLSPTGGAKDYLWFAIESHRGSASTSLNPPDFFVLPLAVATPGGGSVFLNCALAAVGRQINAASQDPAAFTLSSSSIWSAWTVAIHPATGLRAAVTRLELDAPPAKLVPAPVLRAEPASFELVRPPAFLPSAARIVAGQLQLAASTVMAPVVLAHLTTYSDAGAGTVQAEYWWTLGQDVLYEWNGGAAQSFEGAILRVSGITRKMEHLPNATLMELRRTGLELVLGNESLAAGGTRWSELRARNLLYARVELAVLLIPASRRASGGSAAWDLRDLSGIDHTTWFRGELLHVGPITPTEIPLSFEAREAPLDWPYSSNEDECDPRDLGRLYPIPIGSAKNVPLVNRKVGWVTTLASEILSSTFTGFVEVTENTGFPSSAFTVQIGAERMTAQKAGATQLQITARGVAGTLAIAHKPSEQAIEILGVSVFVFSGVPALQLEALYVLSPLTRLPVKVTTPYTINLADASVDAGRILGTVSFTASQFQSMIDAMLAVSQQATLSGGGSVDAIAFQAWDAVTPSPYTTQKSYAATGTSPARLSLLPRFVSDDFYGRVRWTSTAGMPNPTQAISRFRLHLEIQGFGEIPGPQTAGATIWCHIGIYGRSVDFPVYTFDNGASEFGVSIVTQYYNPGSPPKLESSLVGGELHFWVVPAGDYSEFSWPTPGQIAEVLVALSTVEVETEPASLTDLGIAAVSLGWGLEFLADVRGVHNAGVLIERPADVLAWFIATFAGLGINAIDSASFATANVNLFNLVAWRLAGTLNHLGRTFPEVLAGLCFHSRANLVAIEQAIGTVYKLYAAEQTYAFPAAIRTLVDLREQTETRRAASEAATRFLGHFHPGPVPPTETPGITEAREVVRIDPVQNDAVIKLATSALTAAEARFGRRDAEPLLFPLLVERNAVVDVLGYYAFESIADRGRFGVTIPYHEGYDLELGHIVALTPQGYGSPVKARVIQISLHPTEPVVGLVLEQVT